MGARRRRALQLCLGVAFSATGLILVARGVDWDALVDALGRADLGWILVAVAAQLVSILVNAVRWRCLYGAHAHPPVQQLFGILSAAQLGNTILPGRPGLLVRVAMAGGKGVSRATTITTLAVEKVLEGVTLLPVAALLPLILDLPSEWRQAARTGGLVCIGLLLATAAGLRWRKELVRLVDKRGGDWLSGVTRSLLEGLDAVSSRRGGWQLWMVSALYWVTVAAVNWLVMRAMGLALSLTAALILLVAIQIGVRLPSSPGSVGVFDYLGFLSLAALGVDRTPAVGTTLILHLVMYLPASLLGALYLLWTGTGVRLWVSDR